MCGKLKERSFDPLGWHVSFACEIEHDPANIWSCVGIDRGVANTAALSTGKRLRCPPSTAFRLASSLPVVERD